MVKFGSSDKGPIVNYPGQYNPMHLFKKEEQKRQCLHEGRE